MAGLTATVGIITGAARGIGHSVALRLAGEGCSLFLNDVDRTPLEELGAEITRLTGKAPGIVVGDVRETELAETLVGATVQATRDLHIVVTCAGYADNALIHKMTDAQWDDIVGVHLTGTFKVVRAAMREMRALAKKEHDSNRPVQARRVVTVSSRAAWGNLGQANYSAAKAGIIGLTKACAIEGGPFNIMCNTVAFGFIETRLTAARDSTTGAHVGLDPMVRDEVIARSLLRRAGTVEEAAGAIHFLASPDANYITGTTLHVNGGSRL